jgi:hypothetical protein
MKPMTYSDFSWKTAPESLGIEKNSEFLCHFIMYWRWQLFEKFDQKSGMNQNGGLSSSIEESLLYKMH